MTNDPPLIGITLGDPVGIGPEIIVKAFSDPGLFQTARPLVLGDIKVLSRARDMLAPSLAIHPIDTPAQGKFSPGTIDIIPLSDLALAEVTWGKPTRATGHAMTQYILKGVDLALSGETDAIVTSPINKAAMNMAGYHYNGHTELIAERTGTTRYAMMLAGEKLRVVLVSIHMPFKDVPKVLTTDKIVDLTQLTAESLISRFGIENPRIAVAGLNPHAGEDKMFGDEEETIITPAVDICREEGFAVTGPFPPDTVYYHAVQGRFDAVVSMYHDQGLIPFKLIHFENGVNTTLGLPIVRTSVDHGTAYDIAGQGIARPDSLLAAVDMAVMQARFAKKT